MSCQEVSNLVGITIILNGVVGLRSGLFTGQVFAHQPSPCLFGPCTRALPYWNRFACWLQGRNLCYSTENIIDQRFSILSMKFDVAIGFYFSQIEAYLIGD